MAVMPITVRHNTAALKNRAIARCFAYFAITTLIASAAYCQTSEAPRRIGPPTSPTPLPKTTVTTRPSNGPSANSPPAQNSNNLPSIQEPPAFGPGSPGYGQPFFDTPGVTPRMPPPPPKPVPEARAPASGIQLPEPAPLPPPVMSQPSGTQANGPIPLTEPMPHSPQVFNPPQLSNALQIDNGFWTFNFQDAPWPVVLKNFARHSRMSLQLEQVPPGAFSYYDDRAYSFIEALDVLNDYLLRQGYLIVRNESKLTVVSSSNVHREGIVPSVPLRALPSLGRNELVSVAFPTKGGTGAQVVAEVQQLLSPLGRVQPLSNSSRVIVADTGASLRRLYDLLSGSGLAASDVEQCVIHLRNAKAVEVAAVINQRFGRGNEVASPMGIAQASGTAPSSGNLGSMNSVVVPVAQSECLLLEGTPDEIAKIEMVVRQIDREPPQVVIQALLVEVLLGNANETGVELGFQDSVLFDRSVIDNVVSITQTNTNPNGVQTSNQQIISQTASPGFNFNGAALGNNVTVSPSSVGKQSLTNLGLGRVSGDLGFGGLVLSAGSNSVNVLLRALAENHKVDVLSRPQVRAINNREALIQIGQQVPIVEGVALTPNGNANPIIRQDKAGIILRVTPRVADDGVIQIDVQAEKSAYQLAPGSGVPIFTDATKGNIIEAPVKDITTAQTTVIALSGQTIVLGGMITRDQSEVHRKVPFLGDIPLLGRLFRVDLLQNNRKELLIFLTPTIVRTPGESDCHAAQEAERITIAPDPNIDLHQDFMRAGDPSQARSSFCPDPNCEPVPQPEVRLP